MPTITITRSCIYHYCIRVSRWPITWERTTERDGDLLMLIKMLRVRITCVWRMSSTALTVYHHHIRYCDLICFRLSVVIGDERDALAVFTTLTTWISRSCWLAGGYIVSSRTPSWRVIFKWVFICQDLDRDWGNAEVCVGVVRWVPA